MAPNIITSLLILIVTFTSNLSINKIHAFSIEMIRIDSIDSKLFLKNLTEEERHQTFYHLTVARARRYEPDALRPPALPALSSAYVTRVGVGSGGYSPYLLIDTGSDDTWVQCEGCTNCFPIKYGSFDPRRSSTSRPLAWNHALCQPRLSDAAGRCLFHATYFGGADIAGSVLTDTFYFPTSEAAGAPFAAVPGVAFCCGYDNRNVNFGANKGPENMVGGVFGLGVGKRSMLSQLEEQTRGVFSYCLPRWMPQGRVSVLRFGEDAKIPEEARRRAQTTRLMTGKLGYYLELIDISMNTKRLHLDPALFRGHKVVPDTGSAYTMLVREAYTVVRREMVEYFEKAHGWRPKDIPGSKNPANRLCYNKVFLRQGHTPTSPTLTLNFNGASLVLKPENMFEQSKGNWFCMTIFPSDFSGLTIIGAYQMTNHVFLFDVKASKMSFAQLTC